MDTDVSRLPGADGVLQRVRNFLMAFSGDGAPQILIFGDSVALRIATDDANHSSVEDLYRTRLGNSAWPYFVSGSAYNPTVYLGYAKLLTKARALPRAAVVPINLRCFSPTWDLNPLYQFCDELSALNSALTGSPAVPLAADGQQIGQSIYEGIWTSVQGYPPEPLGEFVRLVETTYSKSDRRWRERVAKILAYHYMHPLYKKHRRLLDLGDLINTLAGLGIRTVLYITPINHEAGLTYVGPRFIEVVERNIALIEEFLFAQSLRPFAGRFRGILSRLHVMPASRTVFQSRVPNVHYKNLAFSIPALGFFSAYNATEHLRDKAREFLVEEIDRMLHEIAQRTRTA